MGSISLCEKYNRFHKSVFQYLMLYEKVIFALRYTDNRLHAITEYAFSFYGRYVANADKKENTCPVWWIFLKKNR